MAPPTPRLSVLFAILLCSSASPTHARIDLQSQQNPSPASQPPKTTGPKEKSAAKPPSPEEDLQRALTDAGSDRAALARNLEAFLNKYPDYPNRTRIYRALVEASLQLQDRSRAADYAERMVALNPNDISILLLAVGLLEHQDNEAMLRRAVNYSTRVLDLVEHTSSSERSPRVSVEQWELEKRSDLANTYFLRGDLSFKLKDYASARKDLQASYDAFPSAPAAQKLGEMAELQGDSSLAIQEYARAFALAEGKNGNVSREEIRKKVGNVWRLAHGSEDGLGDYLLHTYDEIARQSQKPRLGRNEGIHELSNFTIRKAPDGAPFPMKDTKGKVAVLNFWATWCGPCHALEPLFAQVATEFHNSPDVLFLSVNCDEDETLVGPYLQNDKMLAGVVFADGLNRLFAVDSFPTVIVIGRDGKIAFRSDGFQPDTFETDLSSAVRRALGETGASH